MAFKTTETCPLNLDDALTRVALALSASHHLTVTDRPDLPREQWPVWVLDHAPELALLDQVREALGLSSDSDP